MLLSPALRKIMTALLVLPAGVIATSSYADCSSTARASEYADAEWSLVAGERSDEASLEARAGAIRSGKRLSRRDFYGDEAAAAVIDISADR